MPTYQISNGVYAIQLFESGTTGAPPNGNVAGWANGNPSSLGLLDPPAPSNGDNALFGGVAAPPTGVFFDSVGPSSAGTSVSGTTVSWSHTVVNTGAALLVFVGMGGANVATTGTCTVKLDPAGANITVPALTAKLIAFAGSTSGALQVFGIANVSAGVHTIQVNHTTSIDIETGSLAYANADLTSPFGAVQESHPAGNVATLTLTHTGSGADSMVAAGVDAGSSINSPTAGTSRWIKNLNAASAGGNAAAADLAGGGSRVFTWTLSGSDSEVIAGVEIKPPSAAPDVAGTPGEVAFTGVAGIPTPNIDGTPAVVNFLGVAGAIQSNLVGTPGSVAFTGVAGAVRTDLVGTPAVVNFTGVAGTISVPIAVTGTPAVVNFAGVAGVPTPVIAGTPGVVAFTGVAGAIQSNLAGTPGVVTFSGVAGVPRANIAGTPGVVAFSGQPGAIQSNLVGTPGVLVFTGVAGSIVGAAPDVPGTPGIVNFTGVAGTIRPNLTGTPGVVAFTGVAGAVRSNLAGTPGVVNFIGVPGAVRPNKVGTPAVLQFLGVAGSVRPNLVGIPGVLVFTSVPGVAIFEPTKLYDLDIRILDGRYYVTVADARYNVVVRDDQREAVLDEPRYVLTTESRYEAEVR